MGEVYFYHLTRHPVDVTLATLIGKARGAGWRILVRGADEGRIDWLDQKLWLSGGEGAFLAHGKAGGPHDGDQPVLLSVGPGNGNEAGCLMCVDGAEISPDEVKGADRACILFDGYDDQAVQHARVQWKTLTEAGCGAQYWSEEGGRWEKKAGKEAEG